MPPSGKLTLTKNNLRRNSSNKQDYCYKKWILDLFICFWSEKVDWSWDTKQSFLYSQRDQRLVKYDKWKTSLVYNKQVDKMDWWTLFSLCLNSANPLIEDEKLENQHRWGLQCKRTIILSLVSCHNRTWNSNWFI